MIIGTTPRGLRPSADGNRHAQGEQDHVATSGPWFVDRRLEGRDTGGVGKRHTVVLADVITGNNAEAAYLGSRTATKLKVAGIEVAAMGLTEPERDTDEHIIFSEPKRGIFRKDGTFSVVPQMGGGVTGGQRIDLLGIKRRTYLVCCLVTWVVFMRQRPGRLLGV